MPSMLKKLHIVNIIRCNSVKTPLDPFTSKFIEQVFIQNCLNNQRDTVDIDERLRTHKYRRVFVKWKSRIVDFIIILTSASSFVIAIDQSQGETLHQAKNSWLSEISRMSRI